jgi:hypothetical protein
VGKNESEDIHADKAAAMAVCHMLKQYGFGGEGRVFPISTRVERVPATEFQVKLFKEMLDILLTEYRAAIDWFNMWWLATSCEAGFGLTTDQFCEAVKECAPRQ